MEYRKEVIKLRHKPLSNGMESLYLDSYVKGRRKYEFLRMYLLPGNDRKTKEKNNETLRLANAIKAKRIIEVQNHEFGFKTESKIVFADFFKSIFKNKKYHTAVAWNSTLEYLKMYDKKKTQLCEIDVQYVIGFQEFLANHRQRKLKKFTHLSINTQSLYFQKFTSAIKKAYKKELIIRDVSLDVEKVKTLACEKTYLSLEEVKKLSDTWMKYPAIKQAFLFSCFTGLRISDVFGMQWKDVSKVEGFTRVTFRQQKTGTEMYLDIAPQAAQYMGKRGQPNDRVFDFKYDSGVNRKIKVWASSAGIDKNVSFHTGRHTFAVMMLQLGTDLYTLSKLLGHKDIKSTQVYAKLVDKSKQNAVLKIPKL